MNDVIESRLGELADRLINNLFHVETRGEGASRFLYIVGKGRSAEVSWHRNGFWVEFWDSLDEDSQPILEATFGSIREVEEALIERLV